MSLTFNRCKLAISCPVLSASVCVFKPQDVGDQRGVSDHKSLTNTPAKGQNSQFKLFLLVCKHYTIKPQPSIPQDLKTPRIWQKSCLVTHIQNQRKLIRCYQNPTGRFGIPLPQLNIFAFFHHTSSKVTLPFPFLSLLFLAEQALQCGTIPVSPFVPKEIFSTITLHSAYILPLYTSCQYNIVSHCNLLRHSIPERHNPKFGLFSVGAGDGHQKVGGIH